MIRTSAQLTLGRSWGFCLSGVLAIQIYSLKYICSGIFFLVQVSVASKYISKLFQQAVKVKCVCKRERERERMREREKVLKCMVSE